MTASRRTCGRSRMAEPRMTVGYQTDEIARESQIAWGAQVDKLAEHLAAKGGLT